MARPAAPAGRELRLVARDVAAARTGVWLLSQVTEVGGPQGAPALVDRGARLERIDPRTGRALARVEVPVAADRLVQGRSGRLWVLGSRLAVADPRTRRVSIVARAPCTRLLADSGSRVWSYSACLGGLSRRTADGHPLGHTVRLRNPEPAAMALGDDGLFLSRALGASTVIERRNPRTGRLLRRARVASPPDGLVLRGGSLWSLSGAGSLDRLDPVTLRRTARIALPLRSPGAARLAVGGGAAWATDQSRIRISRIDPRTERPRTRALAPIPGDTVPVAIATGPRAVWVVVLSDGTRSALCRLNPRSAAVERCFPRSP